MSRQRKTFSTGPAPLVVHTDMVLLGGGGGGGVERGIKFCRKVFFPKNI